jgi:hypothetical protein
LEARLAPQLIPLTPHIASTAKADGPRTIRAKYVRVPIQNGGEGTALRCSARLIRIEHQNGDGPWRSLAYNDTLDMAWANKQPSTREVDLGPHDTDVLDVVYAVERDRELHLATIVVPAYPNLMGLPGHYRFTFRITSENAGAQTVGLRVHWGLNIDALDFPGNPIEIV